MVEYHPLVLQLVQNAIADFMVLGEEEARARGIQPVGGLTSPIPAFRAAARLERAIVLIVDPERAIQRATPTTPRPTRRTMTITEFIAEHEITMEVEGGVDPRHLRALKTVKDPDGWEHYAWRVKLVRGTAHLTTDYRTGTAHATIKANPWGDTVTPNPPKVEDVLDSLALDASSYDNALTFEDFAADLGFDTDSRRAEKIYHACGEIAKQLRFLVSRESYEQLLGDIERL